MVRLQGKPQLIAVAALLCAVFAAPIVLADRFQSTNYTIDAGVTGNSFGGTQTSTNYNLVSSGGESVIGNASGGSYKLGQGYVAQLEKSLQLNVQPANQVAYYPMDENTGKVSYDNSANSQDVTLGGQTFTTGKIGSALQFDGTTNAGTSSSSSQLNFPGDFTISYWINYDLSSTKSLFSKWELGVGGFSASVVTNRPILFLNGSAGIYRYCNAISANTWTHVAFVKRNTSLDCYLNGVLANNGLAGTPPSSMSATTQPFKFGAGNYAGSFTGKLDEIKMFSRALATEEVQAEYTAQNTGIPAGVSFAGGVSPGVSKTSGFDAVVQTDAPGYSLAINQNQNLTSGANTITPVSGSIASPVAWNEGTTKGLGFSLYGTNATAIPGLWGSGNSYAALPGTATTFYTRTGYTAGAKDYLNMRLRLDVPVLQPTGTYTNQMTVTGTMTP